MRRLVAMKSYTFDAPRYWCRMREVWEEIITIAVILIIAAAVVGSAIMVLIWLILLALSQAGGIL